MTLADIDARLNELKAERTRIEGAETEVYARIVGYYRSVRNWNKGKKEEYGRRRNYAGLAAPETEGPAAPALTVVKDDPQAELGFAGDTSGFLYFYRRTCPNCPPVAAWLDGLGMEGRKIDVDRESGFHEAQIHDVVSAPTVIFLDGDGRETGRGNSVAALEALVGLGAAAGA